MPIVFIPLDEGADAVPHADVALVRAHLLHLRHTSHLKAARPVDAQEGGAGVVGNTVGVDELVSLQGVTTVAGSASCSAKQKKTKNNKSRLTICCQTPPPPK